MELDLSSYATRTNLKNVTHVDVSSFVLKANIDTKGFVLKNKYDTDKTDLEKKINDAEKKIHDTSAFVKKQIAVLKLLR